MAKKFAGFTPEQLGKIDTSLAGKQSDEQQKIIAANPALAARVGKMAEAAQRRISMAYGGYIKGYNEGGVATDLDNAQQAYADAQKKLNEAMAASQADPENEDLANAVGTAQTAANAASAAMQTAQAGFTATEIPTGAEATAGAINDPASMTQTADVVKTTEEQKKSGELEEGTGQAGDAPQAGITTAETADKVADPTKIDAATVDATKTEGAVKDATEGMEAAKGTVSDEAQVTAEEGKLSDGAKAAGVEFDEKYVDQVTSGERVVTTDEIAKTQGLDEEAVKAKIAEATVPENIKAAQGTVDPNEIPEAAQIAESDMAQAEAITADGLNEDAVAVAAKLKAFNIDDGTLAEFKEGKIEAQDTVQGQLEKLMKSFDDGTPAWAAGAMRAANAAMASRGLGGSSMAAAAIIQASMESALPIASADANAFREMKMSNLNRQQQISLANAAAQQGVKLANFNAEQQTALQNSQNAFALQSQNLSNMQQAVISNAQIKASLQGQNLSNQQQANLAEAARYAEVANINLNNRQQAIMQDNANEMQVNLANMNAKQQAYIANAQLEAALQGKKMDNAQQVAIANAAKFSDANNMTFTAQQQAQIHNSELMKTIGLAELNSQQAAVLQNAAQTAAMDMANLNNRQQAAVMNAKAFLDMDMANLSNEQQSTMFKQQSIIQSMFNDQAADNAAKQFNASSENQTNQFFANLQTQVAQFNTEQTNAMSRFNAGEANTLAQFNATQVAAREQFNATNSLVVAQANAQWAQAITTSDNAAQNQANRDAAMAQNELTMTAYNSIIQRERDAISYAFKSAESTADREVQLTVASMQAELDKAKIQADIDAARGKGIGSILGSVAPIAFKWALGIA